jgi:hypothetical protein
MQGSSQCVRLEEVWQWRHKSVELRSSREMQQGNPRVRIVVADRDVMTICSQFPAARPLPGIDS